MQYHNCEFLTTRVSPVSPQTHTRALAHARLRSVLSVPTELCFFARPQVYLLSPLRWDNHKVL